MQVTRRELMKVTAGLALTSFPVHAAGSPGPLRMVIGQKPGGGTDMNARLIAEYLRLHYGADITIENQDKAGGVLALQQAISADDLAISTLEASVIFDAITSESPLINLQDIALLDNFIVATRVIAVNSSLGFSTMEDWRKSGKTLRMGARNLNYHQALEGRLASRLTGCKIDVVPGYSTAETKAAFAAGELDMLIGSYSSIVKLTKEGSAAILARTTPTANEDATASALPSLETAAIDPSLLDVAPIFAVILSMQCPFATSVAKSADHVAVAQAMADTKKDSAFLAAAKQAKLTIDPRGQAEIRESFAKIIKDAPQWRTRLSTLLVAE